MLNLNKKTDVKKVEAAKPVVVKKAEVKKELSDKQRINLIERKVTALETKVLALTTKKK